MLKSAISRKRESLADATANQKGNQTYIDAFFEAFEANSNGTVKLASPDIFANRSLQGEGGIDLHMITKNSSGEWYKILSSNGGNGNAMTSVDMTYYYAVMPSNSLRLGLWRYSEIMLSPVIDQQGIDIQREAVKEEKRMRDNQPYSRFYEALKSNLFKKHTYKNKTHNKN